MPDPGDQTHPDKEYGLGDRAGQRGEPGAPGAGHRQSLPGRPADLDPTHQLRHQPAPCAPPNTELFVPLREGESISGEDERRLLRLLVEGHDFFLDKDTELLFTVFGEVAMETRHSCGISL